MTAPPIPPRWRRVWQVGLVGLLVAVALVGVRVGAAPGQDPTELFRVGYQWGLHEALAEHGVAVRSDGPVGYDGQWFLGQAYDPLLRKDFAATFDRPQYRSLRMLFPLAAWLVAAGQPAAIPWALLAVQVLVVGLGCAACGWIVARYRRSPWWGLLFAALPGVVVAVLYGTAEPMALALSALGLALLLDRRYAWAGLALAGAALTKETYLAFAAVAAVTVVLQQRRLAAVGPAALLVGPAVAGLLAWNWYVTAMVPASQRTPNHLLDLPFVGWWRVFATMVRGEYGHMWALAPVVLPVSLVLVLVGLVLALVWLPRSLRGRASLGHAVLGYQALAWSVFGLSLVHIMLERFLSANRVLAPALLAAGLLLIIVWPAGSPSSSPSSSPSGRNVVTGDRR